MKDETDRGGDEAAVADRRDGRPSERAAAAQTPSDRSATFYVPHGPDFGERELSQAVWRGWRRRCPACGTGPMMKNYLKVRDSCTVCSEELHHQRADDGPAYLTILVVGHVMAPLLGAAWAAWRPDPAVLATVFAIGTVSASLWLLPRFKGMMVGFQWAKRMHGFATDLVTTAAKGKEESA